MFYSNDGHEDNIMSKKTKPVLVTIRFMSPKTNDLVFLMWHHIKWRLNNMNEKTLHSISDALYFLLHNSSRMLQITSSYYWRNAINVAKDEKGDFEIWCIPFRDQSVISPKACQNVQCTSTTRKAFRYITYIQSTMCLQCQWYSHKVFSRYRI